MKRALLTFTVLAFFLIAGGNLALAQQQQQQPQDYGQRYGQDYGPQGQGWFCPWCGSGSGRGYGMGPGMMHGWGGRGMGPGMMQGWGGRGMGPGMMHGWGGRGGYGMGPGMMQGWSGRGMGPGMMHEGWGRGQYGGSYGPYGQQQQMEALNESEARDLAENYVAGNPNLKIGKLTEKEGTYMATIVTKDGSLVEKVMIDKETGWMKRAY